VSILTLKPSQQDYSFESKKGPKRLNYLREKGTGGGVLDNGDLEMEMERNRKRQAREGEVGLNSRKNETYTLGHEGVFLGE